MNNVFCVFLMIFLLLVGCSSQEVPEELLSEEEGKYSYLFVYPNDSHMDSPDFMKNIETFGNKESEILEHGILLYLGNAKSKYPKLKIDQAPYYIFFDTKGVTLKTGNNREAKTFLENEFK